MRVRPFFWILLATICIGTLTFAGVLTRCWETLPMQVKIDPVVTLAPGAVLVDLHLTDTEGLPIDQAQITPHVSMPAMPMGQQHMSVQALGHGLYVAHCTLSMLGTWKLDVIVNAPGFASSKQSLVFTTA